MWRERRRFKALLKGKRAVSSGPGASTMAALLSMDATGIMDSIRTHPVHGGLFDDLVDGMGRATYGVKIPLKDSLAVVNTAFFESVRSYCLPQERSRGADRAMLEGLGFVLIDTEDPFARADTTDVADGLVRISSAQSSVIQVLADILESLERDAPEAAVAALRYYAIQQCAWGLSATVGPFVREQAWLHYGPYAMAFIMAHEIGHVALKHVQPPGSIAKSNDSEPVVNSLHAYELEADAYALEVLERYRPLTGLGQAINFITAGLALLAVEAKAQSMFLHHARGSHPSFSTRWANLRGVTANWDYATGDIDKLAAILMYATDLRVSLPDEWWDALMHSQYWDTTFHKPEIYEAVRLIDNALGSNTGRAIRLLQEMQDDGAADFVIGLNAAIAGEQPLEAVLEGWGIGNASRFLDPASPPLFYALVDELMHCPQWGEATGLFATPEFGRRLAGVLVTTVIRTLTAEAPDAHK